MQTKLRIAIIVVVGACDASGEELDDGESASHGSCDALPASVPPARLVTEVVYESEELVFDGAGALVAKKGEFLIAVPPAGATHYISRDPALATLSLGLRRLPGGDFVVAQPAVEAGLVARILRVDPDTGGVTDFFTAADMPATLPPFIIPNAIAVEPSGGLFVTELATSQVLHIAPDRSVVSVASGADAASSGGAAYDAGRHLLYYTSGATIRRVQVDDAGHPIGAPAIFATLPGTRLDGIVLDTCGNAYVVDSDPAMARFALWRVRGDTAAARRLATFDDWVSGAQFGAGPGWDDRRVYVSSITGKVFRVRAGGRGM
jgi:sugar lactone lactonase YvrE